MARRDEILDQAARLFASRGFRGVSIADLGAACGISGPALYKHFAGKEAILAELLVGISERLLREGGDRAAAARTTGGDRAALDALVDFHVAFALDHPELIVVQDRDWSALPGIDRERVRALQRAYIEVWVDTLCRVRDDLDAATARAAVHAGFGLINSTPHSARVNAVEMPDLLRRMARGALLA